MQKRTSNITMLRMQALSILSIPHSFLDSDDLAPIPEKLDPHCNTRQQIHNNDEENIEEQEFSFACTNPHIFADELFHNGKICPIFHAFDQSFLITSENNVSTSPLQPPLIKKLFVVQHNRFCSKPSGVSKEPHNKPSQNLTMVEVWWPQMTIASKAIPQGSQSYGDFDERDLKIRSNSDGKDAFVFLNPPIHAKHNEAKVENVPVKNGNGGKRKTTLSAHEKLYVMNRMREERNKRKSFLPYKQHLVELFSNAHTFSNNLHPFYEQILKLPYLF